MPTARFPLLLAAALAPLLAAPPKAGADEPASRTLYARTLRACVWVEAPAGEGKVSHGTGFIADVERRLVVTNAHVVGKHEAATVRFPAYRDGKVIAERSAYADAPGASARVLGTDPARDLAVLQLASLPKGTAALSLADDDPAPSDRVHSIGNPAASDALWVYTSGTVRQVYRKKLLLEGGQQVDARLVETQAPINPGDSGGPVVGDDGTLVAVAAAFQKDARLVSFCIAASEVRAYLAKLREAKVKEPRTAEDFIACGLQALERKEPGAAADAFTAALRFKPESVHLYLLRSRAFIAAGEYGRAIADCEAALKRDPKNAVAFNNRGSARTSRKEYDQAVADLTRAIELDPKFALAHYNRGFVYEEHREGAKADADYARAVELDPKLAGNVRRRFERRIRVVNATDEPISVYLQYETRKDGDWLWLPAAPGAGDEALRYEFKPGQDSLLAVAGDAKTPAAARRIRLWAVGAKSGQRWLAEDGKDFAVAPDGGYLARDIGAFTWTAR